MAKNVLSKLLTQNARNELLKLLDDVPTYSHQPPEKDRAYHHANELLNNTLDSTVDWYNGLISLVNDKNTTLGKLKYHVRHVPSYDFRTKGNYAKFLKARKVLGEEYIQRFGTWYRELEDLVGIHNNYRSIENISGMTRR